jgi:hypothetical protein
VLLLSRYHGTDRKTKIIRVCLLYKGMTQPLQIVIFAGFLDSSASSESTSDLFAGIATVMT